MSILESNTIDVIGTDNASGEVIVTISDHLDWYDEQYHLQLLQEKLNGYIEFIEDGQIYDAYPQSVNRKIVIEIVSKYEYNDAGKHFLSIVTPIVESIGVKIRQRTF